ncbi:MAG TPA: hypothetical protein VGI54_03755, partial [Solirubrobacteraceae bacterium]
SPAAVSQLVRGLVDAGLVEARLAPDDARRRDLRLTRTGTRVTGSAEALITTRLSPALSALPHPEAHALTRALPHLEAILTGTPPPPRPRPPAPPRPPRPSR